MDFKKIDQYMSLALNEAKEAAYKDEVPVGAVIVNEQGAIIAQTHNLKEKNQNSCHHAEILAIEEASRSLKSWRLLGCDIYVTLEPCPMCLSALTQARVRNIYFGAYDAKGGSVSLGYNLYKDSRFNHKSNIFGGIKHFECSKILSDFFRQKRRRYKS